jgi:YD repeat-containing protein
MRLFKLVSSVIGLSYNVLDQVTAISQGTSNTAFTYDALGIRVNETANGLTTVRHYTDSSDNPEWTSQLNGIHQTTEIYTGSLGSGLG